MKKVAALVLCCAFALSGCCLNKSLYPVGKTDDDWAADEKHCRDISGKATGFDALLTHKAFTNMFGPNDKYNDCLREKGWLR